MAFAEDVYEIVKNIPYGKVASYGQVASMAGRPRNARVVCTGYAFGGPDVQRQLLANEGITFDEDGKVRMDVHRWNGR